MNRNNGFYFHDVFTYILFCFICFFIIFSLTFYINSKVFDLDNYLKSDNCYINNIIKGEEYYINRYDYKIKYFTKDKIEYKCTDGNSYIR